jgi:hypothetical protein
MHVCLIGLFPDRPQVFLVSAPGSIKPYGNELLG